MMLFSKQKVITSSDSSGAKPSLIKMRGLPFARVEESKTFYTEGSKHFRYKLGLANRKVGYWSLPINVTPCPDFSIKRSHVS